MEWKSIDEGIPNDLFITFPELAFFIQAETGHTPESFCTEFKATHILEIENFPHRNFVEQKIIESIIENKKPTKPEKISWADRF